MSIDRRLVTIICLLLVAAAVIYVTLEKPPEDAEDSIVFRETMYYRNIGNDTVECGICFRRCIVAAGDLGYCRNRKNIDGTLYNIVYGKPSAIQVDPVEKEPQHHFLPGSQILCIGTAGCNFHCRFCHNWPLSQRDVETVGRTFERSPADLVEEAQRRGIPTISFTYNEPTSFYEYAYDTAKLAQEAGINVIFHSNGSMSPEPLRALLEYTDAVTIDLKAFDEDFYRDVTEGRLEPVLDTLEIIRQEGVWLEIVNLVIPTLNDDPEQIRQMCRWIATNLGTDIPLHFNRFSPAYRLPTLPATPVDTLEMAYEIAKEEGLQFVVIGNVPGHERNSTFCPECDSPLIERHHFTVNEVHLDDGHCSNCGREIPGIWQP